MWRDRKQNHVSGVAMALFAISVAIGLGLTVLIGRREPFFGGLLVGLYFLFSIKVADQWEKAAVLRLGRYIGLRGPGWFHVIPVVDTLSRYVEALGGRLEVRAAFPQETVALSVGKTATVRRRRTKSKA